MVAAMKAPAGQQRPPEAVPAAAPPVPAPEPLASPRAADLLALQRTAGNAAVARLLSRSPAPVLARNGGPAAPPDPNAEKVRHALGSGKGDEVRKLDDTALATTTAPQRAGLAKILTDQLWTDKTDEHLTMKLIRLKGEQALVVAQLDVLGYRQKLLDSIDDDGLHKELEGLLGAAPAAGAGPLADALASRKPEDVQKIPYSDLRTASRQQRIGLLQIMLDMGSSNAAEEGRILDILESSGADLRAVVTDVKALGIKQRLFDHIDEEGAKQRLTTLLRSLADPELDADLVVFNRSFFGNLGEGLKKGFASAVSHFSIGALVMGMLHPIIHPIDTVAKHLNDAESLIKSPSVDKAIALLRDIFGTLGMWLLVAAGVVALVGVAVSAGVITLPAGLAIEGVAAALLTAATWCGVAFIVLTILKLLLDSGEAGAATTAQEHETESEEIGEGITALGVILVLAGLLKGLGKVIKGLRGAAEDPAKAEPDPLKKQAEEAKDSQGKATEEANKLKDAADKKSGGGERAGHKKGVYDAADPAKSPADWKFKDTVTEPPEGGDLKVAETEFEAPNGAKGMGRRALNVKTGELQMQEIKVPPEAKWINTETPLVEGKGTPTSAYITMRLMRMLGIASGSLKVAVIKNIWNLRAILELRALEKSMPRDQAVAKTNSVTSQETALTQSGHKVTSARVKPGTGKMATLKELLEYWETEQETLKQPNQKIVDQHKAILDEFKLTREQALGEDFFWDYDIEIQLEPIEPAAGGPPATGAPTVVPVPVPNDQRDAGT
jgi:Sec-independent protein translocase protein TatA